MLRIQATSRNLGRGGLGLSYHLTSSGTWNTLKYLRHCIALATIRYQNYWMLESRINNDKDLFLRQGAWSFTLGYRHHRRGKDMHHR